MIEGMVMKIKQITAVSGQWYALFSYNSPVIENNHEALPVACWALVKDANSKQQVVGMIANDSGGNLLLATELPEIEPNYTFLGYASSKEQADEWVKPI